MQTGKDTNIEVKFSLSGCLLTDSVTALIVLEMQRRAIELKLPSMVCIYKSEDV